MTNVLILGAGGQVAGHVIDGTIKNETIKLTLFLRNASRLKLAAEDVKIIEADILDADQLKEAMQEQDVVYVNINGNEDVLAERIIDAMKSSVVKRLIFIAAIGIYDEVPGAFGDWNKQMIGAILKRYKKAAGLIEASGLAYTILRPSWYTNKDEVDYKISAKGEAVTGTEISRKSVADLVIKILEDPSLHVNQSLGMEKEGSDGNKPSWY